MSHRSACPCWFLHAAMLFLARSTAPRSLYDRPTRRSSDLHVDRCGSTRAGRGGRRRPRSGLPDFVHPHLHRARTCSGTPCEERTGARRDRKSTRLNSSHVAISYAVFCLKKKITHVTQVGVSLLVPTCSHAVPRPLYRPPIAIRSPYTTLFRSSR